jgi:hypothetical protein
VSCRTITATETRQLAAARIGGRSSAAALRAFLRLLGANGAGDKVTASFKPTQSAFVVSLLVDSNSGVSPAIALHAELRRYTFGGLRGRQVEHKDGTVLLCFKEA